MLLKNLINIIEDKYPLSLAYEWDNPGLILGDYNQEIKKVMTTLDVTEKVLDDALEKGCDCIISHHPLIFSNVKQINTDTRIGRIILKAAKKNVALYAAHTNMDTAHDGINKKLSDLIGIKEGEIIEKNLKISGTGLGYIGNVDEISLKDFAVYIKKVLKSQYIRFSGNPEQLIKRVAIGSGSCAELIPKAIEMGADTIITGDLKYHTCLDFTENNFSIIDAGHFYTEYIAGEMFCEILKNSGVETVISSQQDIFKII